MSVEYEGEVFVQNETAETASVMNLHSEFRLRKRGLQQKWRWRQNMAKALLKAALAALSSGNPEEAYAIAEDGLREHGESVDMLLLSGKAAMLCNKLDTAEDRYVKAGELAAQGKKRDVRASQGLAECYEKGGRFAEAAIKLEVVVEAMEGDEGNPVKRQEYRRRLATALVSVSTTESLERAADVWSCIAADESGSERSQALKTAVEVAISAFEASESHVGVVGNKWSLKSLKGAEDLEKAAHLLIKIKEAEGNQDTCSEIIVRGLAKLSLLVGNAEVRNSEVRVQHMHDSIRAALTLIESESPATVSEAASWGLEAATEVLSHEPIGGPLPGGEWWGSDGQLDDECQLLVHKFAEKNPESAFSNFMRAAITWRRACFPEPESEESLTKRREARILMEREAPKVHNASIFAKVPDFLGAVLSASYVEKDSTMAQGMETLQKYLSLQAAGGGLGCSDSALGLQLMGRKAAHVLGKTFPDNLDEEELERDSPRLNWVRVALLRIMGESVQEGDHSAAAAKQHFAAAAKLGSPNEHRALAALGAQALESGNSDAAIKLIAKAMEVAESTGLTIPAKYHLMLGNAYWSKASERETRAEDAFKQWLSTASLIGAANDVRGEALAHLGRFYLEIAGDEVRALKCFTQSIQLNPMVGDTGEIFVRLCKKSRQQSLLKDVCIKATARDSRAVWAQQELGEICLRGGPEEALAATGHLQAALRGCPQSPVLWEYLGDAYSLLDRSDAAIKAYSRSLELEENEYAEKPCCSKLARMLYTRGEYEKAAEHFERILGPHPDDINALFGASESYLGLSRMHCSWGSFGNAGTSLTLAFDRIQRALNLKDDSEAVWNLRGEILLVYFDVHPDKVVNATLEKEKKAAQCCGFNADRAERARALEVSAVSFQKASALNPGMAKYVRLEAIARYRARQLGSREYEGDSGAERLALAALQIAPADPLSWAVLGVISEDVCTQEYALTRALQLDTRFSEVYAALGDLYRKSSDFGMAKVAYQQSRGLDADFPEVWTGMAALALTQHPYGGNARRGFEHAIESGGFVEADLGFAVTSLSAFSVCRGRVFAAASRAYEVQPWNVEAAYSYCLACESRGLTDIALEVAEGIVESRASASEASDVWPSHVLATITVARLRLKAGNLVGATAALDRVEGNAGGDMKLIFQTLRCLIHWRDGKSSDIGDPSLLATYDNTHSYSDIWIRCQCGILCSEGRLDEAFAIVGKSHLDNSDSVAWEILASTCASQKRPDMVFKCLRAVPLHFIDVRVHAAAGFAAVGLWREATSLLESVAHAYPSHENIWDALHTAKCMSSSGTVREYHVRDQASLAHKEPWLYL